MPSSNRIFHLNRQLRRPQLVPACIRVNDQARRKFAARITDALRPLPLPRVDLPPCPTTTAPSYRTPSPHRDATSMPKLYGNSTVLRQNRDAIRFGVGPIRLSGRLH